jgi:hypothetical protein
MSVADIDPDPADERVCRSVSTSFVLEAVTATRVAP